MQKLLIIGLVWPEPTSSAAGWRMMQLIELFSKANYQLHFACAASKSAHSQDFAPYQIHEHSIQLNDSSFDSFIQDLKPAVVLFDRFMIEEQYGWRVRENAPNAMTILDTEDLHFLRKARAIAYKKKDEINLYSDDTKRELASILRCDVSLIISKDEFNLLTDKFNIPTGMLFYLPFMEDEVDDAATVQWQSFADRKDFMFIGNFLHEPNWQTVLTLKKELWPLIHAKLPHAELHIYGAYASQKVYDLQNKKENFLIKDRAVDARKTMQNYRLLLAPISFGAGAKGKFIDAMISGTPSVTTTIGAESMQENLPWQGSIQDDYISLTKDAIELYNDENRWLEAQQNGRFIINQNFNKKLYEEDFINFVISIYSHLDGHRKQYFILQIMNFHLAQSAKYLSLWIEEKNKKAN